MIHSGLLICQFPSLLLGLLLGDTFDNGGEHDDDDGMDGWIDGCFFCDESVCKK